MEKGKLKKGLFGYRKKYVNAYVAELCEKYEKKLLQMQEECTTLKKQNAVLTEENADSFKKLCELEAEREYISKAVISAEQRAQKVMEDTEKEMATLKANKMAEIALANEELEKIRQQINELKASAVATLRKYESQMGDLIDK